MGVGEDEAGGSEKSKLEVFDGTNPAAYRLWKRRAQLMLASLPSTISEKKYGPKLMGFVSGEAEHLLEHLEVAKICDEGGDKLIWDVLDEKYGPRQIDLLQESLKTFFYDLTVKPQESYRQFSARFTTAQRKLEEQKITLPNVVLGYMYLKKLRLDPQSESMVLTASSGKLEINDILKAVNSIFPEGKGGSNKQVQKEIFQAEKVPQEPEESDGSEDMQRALDVVAEDIQGREDWDEEDVLEAFETYTDIRRKMREQKTSRGYFPRPTPGKTKTETWQLSGSIRGKIEQLKARTKCHLCKRTGHWKRECPMRSSTTSSTTGGGDKGKEVMLVENNPKVQQMWDIFMSGDPEEKVVCWGQDLANDVRNSGNADTHSTGNRQRDGGSAVVHEDKCKRGLEQEVFSGEDQLRAGNFDDPILITCGVPDTACRKTLVGKNILAHIERHLSEHGMKTRRAKVSSEFRFGNNGILSSEEVVLIPACIGGKRIIVKAAVLPAEGSYTPLLLSKEFLRQLGSVLDLNSDSVYFEKLGCKVKLKETRKGHYAIPLFQFSGIDDAFAADADRKKKDEKKKEYHISEPRTMHPGTSSVGNPMQMPYINEEIQQMLTSLQEDRQLGVATEKNLDVFPDQEEDQKENPVPGQTQLTEGKYKKKKSTMWEVYQQDKSYISWVRSHINPQSNKEMQKFKVFIAFVDQKKIQRINRAAVAPHKKDQVKAVSKRGAVRTRSKEEEMEWETVENVSGKSQLIMDKWGDLAIKKTYVAWESKKAMIKHLACTPVGLNTLSSLLE
eukprot:s192_g41.t1